MSMYVSYVSTIVLSALLLRLARLVVLAIILILGVLVALVAHLSNKSVSFVLIHRVWSAGVGLLLTTLYVLPVKAWFWDVRSAME